MAEAVAAHPLVRAIERYRADPDGGREEIYRQLARFVRGYVRTRFRGLAQERDDVAQEILLLLLRDLDDYLPTVDLSKNPVSYIGRQIGYMFKNAQRSWWRQNTAGDLTDAVRGDYLRYWNRVPRIPHQEGPADRVADKEDREILSAFRIRSIETFRFPRYREQYSRLVMAMESGVPYDVRQVPDVVAVAMHYWARRNWWLIPR